MVFEGLSTQKMCLLTLFLALFQLGGDAPGQAPPTPIPSSPSPQEVGLQILHQSLHESVWGMPVKCDVRQNILVYDHRMTGFGSYIRGGQGSGKLRMRLQVPAGDQMNSLLQVSDGELLYSLNVIGGRSRRTRVDLGKVRERLTITTSSLHDPVVAMYLAIGGQAELIRKLCQQYEWTRVEAGQLENIPVWWLTGKLATIPPPQAAAAEVDKRLFVENQSGLLPTDVVLAVGQQDSAVPFWLYQLEQSRTAERVSPLGYKVDLRIFTEWANPIPLNVAQLTPDLFESESSNDQFEEENKLYLPPAIATASLPQQRLPN